MVSVYTVETIATATDYLTADLVPEGYAIVSGLGEVTVTEKTDNIFTVKVDKIAPEAVATTTTAESTTSETSTLIVPSDATTVASDVTKPASLTATQPIPVTSEVAEAEVAPTTSEESAKPAERTVYLSYITQYVNEDRQVVDSKGHLVAVKTTDETAKTQVTVSVSKDVPAGYELVQAKPEITLQLVEKQINVLAFVVTKKSEEEEIAESQLSNRDVLMRLSLEANLLADKALRQVAKEQAGNTELATAANKAKELATNDVLGSETKTEEELGEQVKTVRASIENLAVEMLKVDEDGILTAMLDASITNQAPVITVKDSSTAIVPVPTTTTSPEPDGDFTKPNKTGETDFPAFFVVAGKEFTEANSKVRFTATDADGSLSSLEIKTGNNYLISNEENATEHGLYGKADKNIGEAVIYGNFNVQKGEVVTWYVEANDGTVDGRRDFYLFSYGVEKRSEIPVRKSVATGVTAADITNQLIVDLTKDGGTGRLNSKFETKFNANYVAVPTGKNTTVTEDQKAGKQVWHEIEGELPITAGVHTVTVKSTNIHGQVVRNNITVELYKLKDISRDTVDQYTDNPVPIHAIVELGSTGDVGTVKLEGVLPESFKLENFNLKDDVATELAKRNLEFVKAESVGVDGTVGTIRAKNGGKVEYTGSGNIDYRFVYSYMEGTETKTVDFTYTILFTDTQAPTVKPAYEYIRVVGEGYTISVPGMDNAYLNPDKINGRLDIYENNVRFEGTSALGKLGVTSVVSKLDDSGKDTSGNSDDQGGNSTKFNINIVGTAPATAGTGIYYLRVGDDNYPSGPKGKKAADHPTNPNAAEENVSVTPITITFVDKVKPITPIPVADQAHLTPTEKKAVVDAVKEANPGNAKLQALPESAFTVNSDGSVSVNYSGENVDGATDTIKNATTKLAGTQNEAKAEIDRKLAENKKAIEEKRDEAIAEINDDIYLTDVQKEVAREAVTAAAGDALKNLDTKATEAKENIDKATTVSEINNAKTDGEAALDNAEAVGEKSIDWTKEKERAKAEVENQSTDALKIINNNPNLSYEEKKAYFDNINATKETAIDNIDKAKDSGDITVAIEDAVKASETEVLKAAKQDALNKLEKDAAKAKEDVADNSNLTKEQLEKALEDIQNDLDKAKAAVNEAATPDAVQKEEDKGVAAIAKDVLDATKQNALNQLEKDAARAKEDVAKNPNLTKEQLEKALEGIQNDLDKAKTAINEAATSAAVQEEMNKGVTALAKDVLDAAKQDAKNKIDKEAESAKKAIDTNLNLTPEEKESAKKVIDTDAQAATAAIDKASTPDAVQVEEDKGVAAINLITAKADAKGAVAAKLADEIKKLEDKQAEAEKAQALADLEKAKETQKIADKAAIDRLTILVKDGELEATKRDVLNQLEKDAARAKEDIAKNPNLTKEQVDKALEDVQKDLDKAKTAINEAVTSDAVQAEMDKGVAALAKDVLDAAKQDAKNKIAKDAAAAKEAIDANPNLSDAEKEASKKAVDADAKAATDAIDASTSPVEAQSAEDKGVGSIAQDVLDAAKQDAKNKIAKEAESAKSAIDSNPNLTDAAKEAAKSEIDKAVEEAIVLINGVRTYQELEKIKLPMAALIKPAAKVTPVVDPNNLTEKEIARIKTFLKENNNLPEGTEINVSKDASVTIKYPDGTIDLLSPVEVVKQADKTAPTVANDGKGNIVIVPSEKAVELVVSYVDNNGKSQTVVVTKGTDGLWTASNTVVIVDPVTGQVIVPGSVIKPGTVVTAYSKDEVGNSSDSAEAEVVAVDENNSAAGVKVKSVTTNANNVEKKAKQLPNTGEEANSATSLGLVALGLGLALLAAKRRRDEEA